MNDFFNHVDSLKGKEKKEFRKHIIKICGIEPPTFYSWMRRRVVSAQAQIIISKDMDTPREILFPE